MLTLASALPLLKLLAPYLATLFTTLGLIVPGILQKDGYSNATNQKIAFAVVFVCSALAALCAGQIGGNLPLDFGVIFTGIHTLLGVDGPFKALNQFLQSSVNASTPVASLLNWSPASTLGPAGADNIPLELQQTASVPALQNPQAIPIVKAPTNSQGG